MRWFEHIAQLDVRYKTQTYYSTANHKYLIPGLGAHRLEKLEPEHIERFYAGPRKQGAKPSTVLQIHRTLRAALNEAEKRERITRNPIRVVRTPPMVEPEMEPLTEEEARAILSLARERRNGVRWAIALALGLRQGEALGLSGRTSPRRGTTGARLTTSAGMRPQTVQPHSQRERSRCAARCNARRGSTDATRTRRVAGHGVRTCPARHSGGLVIVEPKSRAGRRVVSLPSPVARAILGHAEAQAEERAHTANLWHEQGWLFAQPTGRPIDPRADYGE